MSQHPRDTDAERALERLLDVALPAQPPPGAPKVQVTIHGGRAANVIGHVESLTIDQRTTPQVPK